MERRWAQTRKYSSVGTFRECLWDEVVWVGGVVGGCGWGEGGMDRRCLKGAIIIAKSLLVFNLKDNFTRINVRNVVNFPQHLQGSYYIDAV